MLLLASTALAWNELRTDHVEASSFLRSNWNKYEENYHPFYAFDDDPRTGWVEGVEGNGEGQWLEWQVSPLTSARQVKLAISNGYQKSDKLLAANAAPKDVRIELRDGAGRVVASKDTTLERRMGTQDVVVPTTAGFSAVRLVVKSVWAGATYKDSVVSDIRTYVDSDVPYRTALETHKLETVKAWIGQRVATAKYFASAPAAYPFKSSVATSEGEQEVAVATCPATFLAWEQVLAKMKTETAWYQVKLPAEQPAPDGMWGAPATGWFDRAGIGLLETSKSVAKHDKQTDEDIWWETWEGNVHVAWADAGRSVPKQIYTWTRHAGVERGAYDYTDQQILTYDDAGHLVSLYSPNTAEMTGSAQLWQFEWAEGKVARVALLFGPTTAADQDGFSCQRSGWRL